MHSMSEIDKSGIDMAYEEAQRGFDAGGIPIGSILLQIDPKNPQEIKVLGKGHNQRIQKSSPVLHGEISAIENAGRLKAEVYRECTLYTTLSPCSMCAGAVLLYNIPRVVIAENANFLGEEELLRSRGVEIVLWNGGESRRCEELMARFIHENPQEWHEDIGEAVGSKLPKASAEA